ncbi:MAG: TrkH family potassium uptake protein [Cohaesibacteraceae bacterium]|nr:TrkH family potassium uptake protein [Cohaesibacteraceae bacterium]MBL4877091.1 TrkH family potassium uptake protein [Cohaesibacteraceae bacterium]
MNATLIRPASKAGIDPGPIFLVVGALLSTLGIAMFIPALVDLSRGYNDWQIFAASGCLTLFMGIGMWLSSRAESISMTLRQAFLITVLSWVTLAGFGAIPLYWSGFTPSYTDAFFESMSGLTTTGSTVMSGLDHLPPGINLWRGMLQWLGGLGVIVMAIAVMPMLQVGGMQLFKAEAFDTAEKILPRAAQIASVMAFVYLGGTLACAISYFVAGMTFLDAVIHGMTTVATGGMSSHDASIGYYDSVAIDSIAIFFMLFGSLPFILYIQFLRGMPDRLFSDSQVKTFFLFLAVLIPIMWIYQSVQGINSGVDGLRYAAFNVISIMTGTGYATTDYTLWGPLATGFFFILMFIGGCAGSTACGIKIFRLQVLFEDLKQHLNRIVFPHGVFVKRYNGAILHDGVSAAVMSFFFMYMISFVILAALISFTGLDMTTSLSGAATAISNVGPGLGSMIGPSGNFAELNSTAKWLLSFGMLVGRLEFLTVFVLFVPRFWIH